MRIMDWSADGGFPINADARGGGETAGDKQCAVVDQHLRATADHGAVVSGVERVEAEVGSDAAAVEQGGQAPAPVVAVDGEVFARDGGVVQQLLRDLLAEELVPRQFVDDVVAVGERSEEHTSELQSLMRISSAVFGL